MKLKAKQVLLISRPRFWMYVLGTFLVGMIASGNPFGYDESTVLLLVAFGLFFSLPANLLIYGVNDIYDYDTDIHNDKKTKYEQLLPPVTHKRLWLIIALICLPFIPLLFIVNKATLLTVVIFVFTGLFYSAPPIRAKSKPPLDLLFSAIIYVSPALIGYFATGRSNLEWLAVIGGLLWAFGMQTYSAVPDIEADRKAGVETLATYLGERKALWFCLVAFLLSAMIGVFYVGFIAAILGIIYLSMILLSLFNRTKLFNYYTYFPVINVLAGGILFFYLFFLMVL
ncbi:prenyltransferase [Aureitalea sp. L0-47]|uniref:prenyltransferase n=1 Tax=Aureitalea sp. L0-47 TaxID=2816962 RepID=UPI002237D4E8|nr:prenyltransferase [Aureitalea sp. L0-47]MCW5518751.1 prenyltransferase [Aureitalea sp. L0-47]